MYASDIKGEAKSFDINLLNSQSLWFEQLFENLCRIYHQQKKSQRALRILPIEMQIINRQCKEHLETFTSFHCSA